MRWPDVGINVSTTGRSAMLNREVVESEIQPVLLDAGSIHEIEGGREGNWRYLVAQYIPITQYRKRQFALTHRSTRQHRTHTRMKRKIAPHKFHLFSQTGQKSK